MKEKDIQKTSKGTENSITNHFIILIFSIISLLIESLIIISSVFRKGFLKKEILTKKTSLGFDLIIKRK